MLIALIIVVAIVIFIITTYNGLVKSRLKVKNAWSQIDVQLQRRFDLIPNFIETVKGYMTHEKETLTKVTELRSLWAGANSINEKAELNNQLSDTLKTIMAISENYPDLKANQNFISLQNDLKETEDKISYARQFYNDAVLTYNNKVEMVPSNIVAKISNFTKGTFFEVTETEKVAPQVKF